MTEQHPLTPLISALGDLVAFLQDQKIAGIVIGGVAASILGRPRMTRDIDVSVSVKEKDLDRLLQATPRFRFVPRIPDCLDFAHKTRVLLLRHEPSSIDLDLVLASLPFEMEAIRKAVWTEVGRISVPLPCPEDLIIMKALAARPRDGADIEGVLTTHPNVDRTRILSQVSEFASALDMPGILDDLKRILDRHPQ